jgi:hypothetical protein
MLLDFLRPIEVYNLGYSRLIIRGILLACMELVLLYVIYKDENPTSFVYFTFGALIFASKMRLRPSQRFVKGSCDKEDLEIRIRDNLELFTTGVAGKILYLLFAIAVTLILGCSLLRFKTTETDTYPFFLIKPEEEKTKYLLVIVIMSWAVFLIDFTMGRSYHWSELRAYDKFKIKYIEMVIEFLLVFFIFSFSQQVKFSIFSLIFFFFVLLTITVFLVKLLRENKSTVSFDNYVSFLKWLTLIGMIVIYCKKSYAKFIDILGRSQSTTSSTTTQITDFVSIRGLVDQFIDKEENFDRILLIFFLSSLRLYFGDIRSTINNIKEILREDLEVSKDSYYVNYFASNILMLLNKRGSDIINYNRSYKLEYFNKLQKQELVRNKFDEIFAKVKIKITTLERFILFFMRIFKALLAIAIKLIKNHLLIIFEVILAYLIITNTRYMVLMIMPIIWCMLSFVAFNPNFSTTISIIFLYIPTSLAILQLVASNIMCKESAIIYNLFKLEKYCGFMKKYPVLSDNQSSNPIEDKERLFMLLSLSIFYIILLIEKRKNLKYINFSIVEKFDQLSKSDIKEVLYEDVMMLIKFLISKIFSNFFYICLVFLFMGIMQTISFFNFIFILFFFVFILNSSKAKQYWVFLLLYLQFLLIIRFLYSLKIFTFNLDRETNAMLGLYFGTGDPKAEPAALTKYWWVLIAISIQYQLFHTKLALEFKRVELDFQTTLLKKAKLIVQEVVKGLNLIYMNAILWFFHFFLILILIYSEKTIFNFILMVLEVSFFLFHLIVSKGNMDENARRKINKVWMIILVTILFFAFLFYIFLFCKYTVVKRFIESLLGFSESSGNSGTPSFLQSKIAQEFTMVYLLRQKKLEIEENSFIRENLKILLAFISFFKIYYENKQLERSQAAGEEETGRDRS